MNIAVVVTSLVRSYVVFKLLNYVTDKIIRVALIIVYNVCKLYVCVCEWERAGERIYFP